MKIFTEKQVDISAFLAGPIPPGILIYRNYRALCKDKQAYITLACTFIFTVGFFYGMMQIPDEVLDKIPNVAFTLSYGLLVFLFFRFALAEDVANALEGGAQKASNWTVAGITAAGLFLNLAIIFALAMNAPYFDGEVLNLDGNELYYDENIPKEDLQTFSSQLQEIEFFGPGFGNTARLELIDDTYRITLLIDEQYWTEAATATLTSWKWLMEVEFGRTTHLTLESPAFAGSKFKTL